MTSVARATRLSAGLSIEEAATQLGIPGGYLSDIETGKRQVSAERAEQIAHLYGVPKERIFLPSRYAIREVDEQSTA